MARGGTRRTRVQSRDNNTRSHNKIAFGRVTAVRIAGGYGLERGPRLPLCDSVHRAHISCCCGPAHPLTH
eukprot:1994727-Prymnesium_polylepis.1